MHRIMKQNIESRTNQFPQVHPVPWYVSVFTVDQVIDF